jgi:single-strand DNA-binding protein
MSVKFNSFCELDVVGTVTKDPEMKYTPEGKAVTTIDVAYNEYVGKSDDQASATVPMWIRLTAWEKDAETLNNYLHKGDTLHAKCRIKFDHQTGSPRLYQRSDGTIAASYEASIKECTVISKNKNGTNGNGSPSNGGDDFEPQGQQGQQPVPQQPQPGRFTVPPRQPLQQQARQNRSW